MDRNEQMRLAGVLNESDASEVQPLDRLTRMSLKSKIEEINTHLRHGFQLFMGVNHFQLLEPDFTPVAEVPQEIVEDIETAKVVVNLMIDAFLQATMKDPGQQFLTAQKVMQILRPAKLTPKFQQVADWITANTQRGLAMVTIESGLDGSHGYVVEIPHWADGWELVAAETQMDLVKKIHAFLFPEHQDRIWERIKSERLSQIQKWGHQRHGRFIWSAILSEECGEVAQSCLKGDISATKTPDQEHLEEELVQVAAVAVAWLEHLISGEGVES